MSQIELMYQGHLDHLRGVAEEQGVRFIDILIEESGSYSRAFVPLSTPSSLDAEQLMNLEKQITERYRVKFYENVANLAIEHHDSLQVKFLQHLKQIIGVTGTYQNKMKIARKIEQNLTSGRQKGAIKNKERASVVKQLATRINDELLQHPDSARWTVEQRADFIQKQLSSKTVEIGGKLYPATMANGRKYLTGTIQNWITGV
jgi:hypothetical protein